MPFNYKDRDELKNSIIDNLTQSFNNTLDLSDGEPLRTIVEAFVEELDLQYWQLEQNYNSSFIDSAYGDDLTNLVALLGISRNQSTMAKGTITFYRETPATQNYYIPEGTLVESIPTEEGIVVQFLTIEEANLLIGQTSVDVPIEATEGGSNGNVAPSAIRVINDPPTGIEGVINNESTAGGEEEEIDEELRERALAALETAGKGTLEAIKFYVNSIEGIREVSVVDMARGIGTIDVLVLGELTPLPQEKIDEIEQKIDEVKSAGIDSLLKQPELITQNVTVTLQLENGYALTDEIKDNVAIAIKEYINDLSIGERMILNQLRKYILNSNEAIIDISLTNPTTNLNITSDQVIRTGTISIQ